MSSEAKNVVSKVVCIRFSGVGGRVNFNCFTTNHNVLMQSNLKHLGEGGGAVVYPEDRYRSGWVVLLGG